MNKNEQVMKDNEMNNVENVMVIEKPKRGRKAKADKNNHIPVVSSEISATDKKRQNSNNRKNEILFERQKDIIRNIRSLQMKRKALLDKTSANRTDNDKNAIAELNVEIAKELSQLDVMYQFQYELFEKAEGFKKTLNGIRSDCLRIFELHNLPTEKLKEYFSDNNNERWYVGNKFWKKWIEQNDEYHDILTEKSVWSALREIDVKCLEFEKNVGVSPTQFNNIFVHQIGKGMRISSDRHRIIIEKNIRLAMNLASNEKGKRAYMTNLQYPDLFMEALIGLIKGIEKFEYSLEYRVSTYVSWWIRQAISRYVEDLKHTFQVSNLKPLYKVIAIISKHYRDRHYKEPSQHYIIMKHLLKLYAEQQGGYKNVLPKEFIEKHITSVSNDVVNYVQHNWTDIDGTRLGIFNILLNNNHAEFDFKDKEKNKQLKMPMGEYSFDVQKMVDVHNEYLKELKALQKEIQKTQELVDFEYAKIAKALKDVKLTADEIKRFYKLGMTDLNEFRAAMLKRDKANDLILESIDSLCELIVSESKAYRRLMNLKTELVVIQNRHKYTHPDFVEKFIWTVMLDIYEMQYGLQPFAELEFFKEQFQVEQVNWRNIDKNDKNQKDTPKKNNIVFRMKEVFAISQPVVSLENEVGDEENNTYRDTIKADQPSVEEEVMEKQQEYNIIDYLKKVLSPREVEVVMMFFGISCEMEYAAQDIAKHLTQNDKKIGSERVRQIKNTALKKLSKDPVFIELYNLMKNNEIQR